MADFPVPGTPEFKRTMGQITTKDRGAPETFNPRYQVLLDNDNFLRGRAARMEGEQAVSLPASGWSPTAPYMQTANVPGVTAEDAPVIGMRIADGATAAAVKLQKKAWACVDRAVTGAGTITFYCYGKKPANDFMATVKGVG